MACGPRFLRMAEREAPDRARGRVYPGDARRDQAAARDASGRTKTGRVGSDMSG